MTRGYNAYIDRGNALVQQERANKLADLQYNQAMDAENQRRALRSYINNMSPNDPNFVRGLRTISPEAADKFETQQADINKKNIDTETAGLAADRVVAQNVFAAPEQAIPILEDYVRRTGRGAQHLEVIKSYGGDSKKIKDFAVQYAVPAGDLKGTIGETNTGGRIRPRVTSVTGETIYGEGVPVTMSPSELSLERDRAAQRDLAERKFAYEKANPGFELKENADGTFYAIDKRTKKATLITIDDGAPMAPASNAFSPRLPPTAAPAVTQVIPGMPSVLDQRAPVAPVVAVPAAPMAGTPLRGKGSASATTEGERKAATLLQRLQFSQGQLTQALVDDPNAAKPGVFTSALDVLSTPAANFLTSEARQRVESAQLDMLDAALTLGTGAAYTKEQLESYRRSYFPSIGDGPKQIEDKKARLENVISAAKIAAGKGAALVPDVSGAANNDPLGIRK
jgi:hypothetical protein